MDEDSQASAISAQSERARALLAKAKAIGEELGLPTELNDGVLVINQVRNGRLLYRCYVVDSQDYFEKLTPKRRDRYPAMDLNRAIEELNPKNSSSAPAKAFLLTESFAELSRQAYIELQSVGLDEDNCLKRFGDLGALRDNLAPVLPARAAAVPHSGPVLTTGPRDHADVMRPQPQVDVTFTYCDALGFVGVEGLSSEDRDRLVTLYHRLNGPLRVLRLNDDDVGLGWPDDPSNGVPLPFCGNTERVLFGLLHFLVRQYREAEPGTLIGISEVLNGFGTVASSLILDLLVEFCEATGTRLYLQHANSGIRRFARRKFDQAFPSNISLELHA